MKEEESKNSLPAYNANHSGSALVANSDGRSDVRLPDFKNDHFEEPIQTEIKIAPPVDLNKKSEYEESITMSFLSKKPKKFAY